MGAGHDGAARELARRLQADGHEAQVRDFLDAAPLRIGALVRRIYEFMIRRAPWSYELTYRVWFVLPFLCPPVAIFIRWMTGRRLQRWAGDFDADVVVSTYPLATVSIGALRRKGRLPVPAVNFITDFGVHPLWVHPGIDLNLATHPVPAGEAARRTGQPTIATGPLVSPRFAGASERQAAREAARRDLSLDPEDRAVLIVAGSWGVGAVAHTFDIVAGSGRFVPIVVCGRDDRLRRRLLAAPGNERGRVLGWTDEMPALMAACDALIENAGGLTSMEALAAGLPVVSFGAIAGHGKENTAAMEAAGVSRRAGSPAALLAALEEVSVSGSVRQAQIEAGRAMFVADPAGEVLAMAGAANVPDTVAEVLDAAGRHNGRYRAPSAWLTRAAAVGATIPLAWAAVTFGVGVAAANGVGVAHPTGDGTNVAFLAVHVDAAELNDPAVINILSELHVTAIVDGVTARADPSGVRQLAAHQVAVANGGTGIRSNPRRTTMPWRRARADVVTSGRLIGAVTGEPARLFLPLRRLNGFDLLACHAAHALPIVPDDIIPVAGDRDDTTPPLRAREVYVLDGDGVPADRLLAALDNIISRMEADHLTPAPLVGVK
jgi:UDP-N-acetylglucosamine:LPS N-acetylglucosamine transferase